MASVEAKRRGTAWLEAAGVRVTKQRALLAALLVGDGCHRHVTAESLYDAVRAGREHVSLATVYNTLRSFCEAGLLREIVVNGTKSYFDTNTSNHAHFYWDESGQLADATSEPVELSNLPAPPGGTEIASVDVVIRLRKA